MFEWNCSRTAMKCPINVDPNSPPNKRVTWKKPANVNTSAGRFSAPLSSISSTIEPTIELKASQPHGHYGLGDSKVWSRPYGSDTRIEQACGPYQTEAGRKDQSGINSAHQSHCGDAEHELRECHPKQHRGFLQRKESSDRAKKAGNAHNRSKHDEAEADEDRRQQQRVPV